MTANRLGPAWNAVQACVLASVVASLAHASTPVPAVTQVAATTPGVLTAYSTILSAGFEWRIGGDDNDNCTVTLEYRKLGDATWKPAQPLIRVEHGLWTHGEDPGNLLAGSLFYLQAGTSYEARLTLSDPDGGADQRIVSFATRVEPQANTLRTLYVVPGSGGGTGTQANPFRGLAAADAAALPGDLILVGPGVYFGQFVPTHDGTPTHPIVYRGTNQALVVLDRQGATTIDAHCVRLAQRRYVHLENLSLVNCIRPINADSTVGVVVRGCYLKPITPPVQQYDIQALRAAFSRDLFIADNLLEMPGHWATIGRTGEYGTGGYGILVEGTGHVVCHNTIIEAWDAISIPVTDSAAPACTTSNVDIYENYVDRASDDGIQADAIKHNIRIFRNRLLNTGSGVSFQPAFGGPGYILSNELYNNRIEPYKFHQETSWGWTQETSGFLVYHNTEISSRAGWLETGIWRHGRLRNNLVLGGRAGPTLDAGYTYPGASFDYDGFSRAGSTLIHFMGNYANLPAFFAGTGNEQHGIEVTLGAFVSATYPHDPQWNASDGYGAPYGPSDNDLRLAAGSAAIDKGVALANIDDGFAGSAPDLGCYESGAAVPAYGPRVTVLPPVGVAASSTSLALSPNFPNPFSSPTTLQFSLAEPTPISLRVYDLRGALVRTLVDGLLSGGPHTATWDGRATDGHRAASGIYFVRLTAQGRSLTRRVVLAR